jgi:hypothetical protein
MIVEHEIVTILPEPDARCQAAAMLASMGFSPTPGEEAQWMDVRRGKKNEHRARAPCEAPQRVRLAFDRQRITVAASAIPRRQKRDKDERRMLLALVNSLQARLVEGRDEAGAMGEWVALENRWQRRLRRRKIALRVIVSVLVLAVVGLVIVPVVLASVHH